MKKLIFTICLMALLPLMSAAQTGKVLEKSARHKPDWIGMTGNGCLVTEVTAPTLGECETKALDEITRQILRSIAFNVSEQTSSDKSKVTTEEGTSYESSFSVTTRTRTAQLPFLSEISLARAKDVYWEKLQDRQTKEVFYVYSVQYPYSITQQRLYREKFEQLDNGKVNELETLQAGVNRVSSIQEITQALLSCDKLLEYFFDDTRLTQTQAVKQSYNDLYNQMMLTSTHIGKDRYLLQLVLQGRAISCSVNPRMRSNCASSLTAIPTDEGYVITCDTRDCLPEEDNVIDVTLPLEKKTLRLKIPLVVR